MRLIGTLENQKQAFTFYSFLLNLGIHSTYESQYDKEKEKEVVYVWVYEEDQIERAIAYLAEYKSNPSDPKFSEIEFPEAPPQPPDLIAEQKEKQLQAAKEQSRWKMRLQISPRKKRSYPIMYTIILLCTMIYFWTAAQQVQMLKTDGPLALQIALVPIQQQLMFDYPKSSQKITELLQKYSLKGYEDFSALPPQEVKDFKSAEQIPTWRGVFPYFLQFLKPSLKTKDTGGPLFEKIREGEIWRLFTPALLHGGILHILFNMAWAWLLLRQVEERLPKYKLIILILFLGIVTNLSQYIVSGPYFLGFSGVIVGLVGFIRMRQKVAPWEGYPLQRATVIFVFIFVGAMFLLEVVTIVTALFSTKDINVNIANTAHIMGGIFGTLIARLPFFSRGIK